MLKYSLMTLVSLSTHGRADVLLDKSLSHLEANHFIVKSLKCDWAFQETNLLRYWLIPTGLKPWKKCISAFLEQEQSYNMKEMCSFYDAANTYWLMWPKQAHLL